MCNSISVVAEASELIQQFKLDHVLFYTSNRYEINPTQSVSAIITRKDERVLDEFRWGLMPFWAKDSIWADSGSLLDKRAFRRILQKQRCIIPCSGYFVSQMEGKRKVWIKFTPKSGSFGIAGLYDVWRSASGDELRTCTMLTTEANRVVSPYHHRMPAIMDQERTDQWLQPGLKDPLALQALLSLPDHEAMVSIQLTSPEQKLEADLALPEPGWA
ncbi:SOS response-associated peptidase [Paenibacillus thalictri]|uniref:Abasic site processing protein n=1 Tax=Paenibacillus thalictri TaxID=2527873 RepID=A0A4Q9DII6_9BACL|nr:SOS response-associated peptidase [Paenibacillus thalictri]TBL72435.1 SOS response-associated peptidase [Paenibacillus thalictri]